MDSSTLVTLLLLALTAIASPFSLIAFSLVLATDRGPRNGIAFIGGWVFTVTMIGVIESFIDVNLDATESNTPGKWILAVQLVLGIVLLVVWARRRFQPKEPTAKVDAEEKPKPAWQRRLNTMGYVGAFVTGGAVQTWPVMIAAGAAILRLNLPGGQSFLWMFTFALVSTIGIVVLEVLAWRNPGSAGERLEHLQNYIRDHRDSVLTWVSLVAGLWLVSRAAIGLL
jgi:threonine/homoserine/homoserine lactone efflux protein